MEIWSATALFESLWFGFIRFLRVIVSQNFDLPIWLLELLGSRRQSYVSTHIWGHMAQPRILCTSLSTVVLNEERRRALKMDRLTVARINDNTFAFELESAAPPAPPKSRRTASSNNVRKLAICLPTVSSTLSSEQDWVSYNLESFRSSERGLPAKPAIVSSTFPLRFGSAISSTATSNEKGRISELPTDIVVLGTGAVW